MPRGTTPYLGAAVFVVALLVYGLAPSRNSLYADDSLSWAWQLSQGTGLVNSHHLYLNPLKAVYAWGLGSAWHWDPALFMASYSALWGAVGLFALYQLLLFLGCGRASLPGTVVCGCTNGYWSYAIVGDVYVPATAALVLGTYLLLLGLDEPRPARRAPLLAGTVTAFLVMILHHQAYAWFVCGLPLAIPFFGNRDRRRRALEVAGVAVATGVLALSVYAAVFAAFPNPRHESFASFVSGYAGPGKYQEEADQKSLAPSMFLKAGAGEIRAVFPYYVAFRSPAVTRFVQRLSPARAVYAYPFLVRTLGPVRVALILIGLLAAGLTGAWLAVLGLVRACSERGPTFALLVAALPQAVFFVWWLGVSDEFWIWSLPFVALLAATGAVGRGTRAAGPRSHSSARWRTLPGGVALLTVCAAGLFVSTGLGAVALFADPGNDLDAVDCAFVSQVTRQDLVLGLDRIQPAARINLSRLRQGFQYVNVFDRAAQWDESDFEAVRHAVRQALARGGRVFVSPYLSRPPSANIEWIRRLNPAFPGQWTQLAAYLHSLPADASRWPPERSGS